MRQLFQGGSMSVILFGWELGAGLGHAFNLLRIAKDLAELGHKPVFVLQNLNETRPLFAGLDYEIYQAPVWWPRPISFTARGYADILTYHGYADAELLLGMVQAWDRLLQNIRPDLIISDHSPTLNLAAHGRFRRVTVGTGFTVPPPGEKEFPALQPKVQPLAPDEQLLASVSHVQAVRKGPPLETLTRIVQGDASFVTTLPELDPYAKFRRNEAVGPLKRPGPLTALPEEPYFFAYLPADHPAIKTILGLIGRCGLKGMVYVRNAGGDLRKTLGTSKVEFVTVPQDLSQVFARTSVVLHHGGNGISSDALAAGRPQVVCPIFLEQWLTGRRLQELGVAELPMPEKAGEALRLVLGGKQFYSAAQSIGEAILQRRQEGLLPSIIRTCERLLFS